MRVANHLKTSVIALLGSIAASMAVAQESLGELETIGKPVDRLMGFQTPVTEVARDLQHMITCCCGSSHSSLCLSQVC